VTQDEWLEELTLQAHLSGAWSVFLRVTGRGESGRRRVGRHPAAPSCYDRALMAYEQKPDSTPIAQALAGRPGVDETVTVKGWVRTRRDSKAGFSFINLHDGSCFDAIQVVAPTSLPNYQGEVLRLSTGCSLIVTGTLVASQGKGQAYEIQASEVQVVGWVDDPDSYPVSAKQHSFEYLREVAHLRPRTNTIGAVARVRHAISMAMHRFFDENGFFWVHTPIITTSDAEGAGQMFRVSTLDFANLPRLRGDRDAPREGTPPSGTASPPPSPRGDEKPWSASDPTSKTPPHGFSSARGLATGEAVPPAGDIDFSKDFFGKPASLTVSGQLNVEAYCLAMSKVYTFGPTFRAENSNTPRHLAEFWMIEPEIAFADLSADADLAEAFLKYIFRDLLEKRPDDMKFFAERIDKECISRLERFVESSFERMDYTDAITALEKSGKKFEFPVKWGVDLQTEHERYLTEQYVKKPLVVMNYPKEIKAFYMRVNDDGRTVAAMDVLAPGIGEIIGGSQREERLDVLDARLAELGMDARPYWWYRDLRRYGTVPHAGFGLGFERTIMYATGMQNVRDVIPFPRVPGNAEF
jgi:asparaginyl-tRNA synthetase